MEGYADLARRSESETMLLPLERQPPPDFTACGASEQNNSKSARKRRVSQFTEHFDAEENEAAAAPDARPGRRTRCLSDVCEIPELGQEDAGEPVDDAKASIDILSSDSATSLEQERRETSPRSPSHLQRLLATSIALLLVVTLLHSLPLTGAGVPSIGVLGGVIDNSLALGRKPSLARLRGRDTNDPTNYCTRWAQQSANVNGTVYVYGGRAKHSSTQTDNTWNNDFWLLDLTQSWQVGKPTFKGLSTPSGPPAVSEGYLWHSFTQLFLYGGEYSDSPKATPDPYSLWSYDIASSSWSEHQNPKTSSGNNSADGDQAVQRAAEGAGISVPSLGKAWYFGGHYDGYTTPGWSLSVWRLYLKSMLEFTFPGYSNDGVDGLGTTAAGSDGAWRNITEGGLQDTQGFTERADGVLVYVPGFGRQGILLGLAGGTNTTYTEMNVIDVFDIANSTWYKQQTSGPTPPIRVNPCAVAASAADGSSINVYLYGGQSLLPFGNQTQMDDMWILTVPSFTWIKVDTSGQSNPPARAGHSCEIWDGQMVVIGGYVGKDISCDFPGIYVFDLSQLRWQSKFNSLSGADQLGQQESQSNNAEGLSGSYGYQVPAPVQSVVGGDSTGGATVTAPASAANAGPIATGGPIVYTVTANGATITETAGANGNLPSTGAAGSGGPNIAAIVAGVVAGVLFVVACYLGFCAWVYRRQLNLYKNHVAAAQRASTAANNNSYNNGGSNANGGGVAEKTAFLFGTSSGIPSSHGDNTETGSSHNVNGNGNGAGGGVGGLPLRTSTGKSSTDDLLVGHEPSFIGILLSPRRSLRVVNRD